MTEDRTAGQERLTTSPQQKPLPHPFYGDSWERGLDPWHADAFPVGLKHIGTFGERKAGWFLIDGAGNAISFVADGTVISVKTCKWCAEGPPEWSEYSKVWLHRRVRMDRRCDNPPLTPPQPESAKETES
jgi:hypothetical protein